MKMIRYIPSHMYAQAAACQPAGQSWMLAVDVVETQDAFMVQASIPGVSPDEVEIAFQEDILTIKGERKADESIKGNDYHLRERHSGAFSRSLRFNTPVDSDKVEASYQYGVLTLRVPKAEQILSRKITVQVR